MAQVGAQMHEYKALPTYVVHHTFLMITLVAPCAPLHPGLAAKQIVGIPLAYSMDESSVSKRIIDSTIILQ
jgi:hypothetical protein